MFGYAGAAAAGAAVTAAAAVALDDGQAAPPSASRTISPYGAHQAGVAAASPKFGELVAFRLLTETDKAALGRLLRLWSADVVALSNGRGAPGDVAPELAVGNAGFTATVGFGGRVFELAGPRPGGFDELPGMRHDRLQKEWTGGDLLVQVGADDAVSVVHAVRQFVRDARPFAAPVWRQSGFWNGTGADGQPVTGRNLFGQVDGTGNPRVGTPEFDATVWDADGGTTLVVRRIRMNLETWDELTRSEQERAVGRKLSTGAPLTGVNEHDELDLEARDADGRPLIAANAHARLSHHSENDGRRIFRKGLNYVHDAGTARESGLIFLSYQADVAGQFLPLLARLDAVDALNEWTTTIGSAVFAIPPGFRPGGWIGEKLIG
nr:Dyp-type peroxidase [Kribbella sandramycini]